MFHFETRPKERLIMMRNRVSDGGAARLLPRIMLTVEISDERSWT